MKPHEVDPFSWSELKKAIPAGIIGAIVFYAFAWGFCYAMAMIGVLIR